MVGRPRLTLPIISSFLVGCCRAICSELLVGGCCLYRDTFCLTNKGLFGNHALS